MVNNERQLKIVELITQRGNVSVDDLAKELNVSKMTIRRDLEKLQEEKLLQRSHGGAFVNKVLLHEVAYNKKREKNQEIKKRIAEVAVKYVQPNMTIFLDAGTTTYELAQKLSSLTGLTIITNDLMIASTLFNTNNLILLLGGLIQKETGSTTGHFSIEMLQQLNIDIAFMAVSSIDNNMMMCTPDVGKQHIKQKAIDIADKCILLADSSKFFQKSLYKIGPITLMDVIITDFNISAIDGIKLGDTIVDTV